VVFPGTWRTVLVRSPLYILRCPQYPLRQLVAELYDDYVAGIAAGTPDQKWLDLRDGDTYTYGGEEFQYKGLDDLLVPCIYALWVRETSDKFTNSSTVRNTLMNATAVSPGRRIADAYGKFIKKVGHCYDYKDTLYGFLTANYTTYPNWRYKEPGSMNDFDI